MSLRAAPPPSRATSPQISCRHAAGDERPPERLAVLNHTPSFLPAPPPFDPHRPQQPVRHAQRVRQRTRAQTPTPADFPGRPHQHLPNPLSGFTPSEMMYGFSSCTPSLGDFLHPPSSTILACHSAVSIGTVRIAVDSDHNEPAHVFPKTREQSKQSRRLGFRILDEGYRSRSCHPSR